MIYSIVIKVLQIVVFLIFRVNKCIGFDKCKKVFYFFVNGGNGGEIVKSVVK